MSSLSDADLLARLVAFDTTSHNSNLPIADFICDYLDRPGIRIERNPSPDGTKTNLIVTVGPATDGETRNGLMLSGHMDVVPALEPDWQSDPFELTETEDAWVGRGACDMKGFVALAINQAVRVHEMSLEHPLALILTYDEELGTLGARHFVRSWTQLDELPRRSIIGEPTSLEVVRMHKGHATLRLTFRGVGAHSGYPHLGHNAIEPAASAISAIAELRRKLETERPATGEFFPEVPFVALNVARVRGGSAINIVPDLCTIDIGIRVLPGMTAQPIADQLRATVTAAVGDHEFELSDVEESPPMLLEASSDLYSALCRRLAQETTVSASYATDAGWFQTAGFECLLWGPGTIEVAHKPNESIPKRELARASQLLGGFVDQFCVASI
ncbi:MAG: acetylornithine deacetylase [Acidobacteriota bacterium]